MKLPRSVQEIADVIGRERALYLIGQLPRCRVKDARSPKWERDRPMLYVPALRRLTPDHVLVAILGWNDAEKLCRYFGGEILQPANCAEIYRPFRDRGIAQMVADGIPPKLVAELFNVTDRHVRTVRREIPQEDLRAANDNNATTGHNPKNEARA